MRKSYFNDEFLVLLGPIISSFFTCSNEEKTKGACSSPISMDSDSTDNVSDSLETAVTGVCTEPCQILDNF